MNLITVATIIFSLITSGAARTSTLDSFLKQIRDYYEERIEAGTFQPEEGDFYQDEEGNLVMILPEGYSVGGI